MQARSGGGSVFVHCGAGISRAPSVSIATSNPIRRVEATHSTHYLLLTAYYSSGHHRLRHVEAIYYSLLITYTHQVTIAYVMWKLGLGATDALRLVKGARACVRPNPGFVAQLKAWEARLKAGVVML